MLKIRPIQALLVVGALAGLVAAGAQFAGPGALSSTTAAAQESLGTSGPPVGPELTSLQIEAVALKFAGIAQDARPASVSMARGSFARAQSLVDGSAGANTTPAAGVAGTSEPVFLVVMHGSFTLNAPRPKGAADPGGSVMALILDAHTGFPEGRYVGAVTPELQTLGPVTQLVGQ
jgi:hypothetical protein